ncbi:hypothetical protein OB2597_13448 [Pseudooceanicola batsensis HTCC2597]|uniref:Uncharacterized protein n=1 Tax=Pseudooceanicola batsensis (strain ATCC BAA-863 / DSM 15984 / KCTC 12145 / HTCC2597) TaxID=252305 RepID=A3TYB8_PSEBH|nr:hypothetical protein [Pseudooceanicola batsensis]EAQ03152.1 hypothetical protein OB2597_13448 [Pseudooceanicola batsensis HTCC2597]
MAKYVIMDMKKVPIKTSGLIHVEPPELSFKVVAELDKKMEKGAEKDPLLQQEFQAQAKEILDQTVKMIEQKCKVFDKLFDDMIKKGASVNDVKKQLTGLNKAISEDMKVANKAAELGVQKAWQNLQGKKKEWKKFKIKVAASIVGTLAGLGASIAAMATSPFSGGAGAVVGIAGLIKSGISLAKDINKLAIGIDTANTQLERNLKFVEATAKKKGLYTANEVGAGILNEFIGIAQPSIKSVQDAADTIKAKYAQMIVKMHELSKVLNKILAQQDKLKKEFLSEAAKKLKKYPIKDTGTQQKKIEAGLDDALSDNYKKVQSQIDKVQDMYGDARKWANTIKDLMKRVAQVELKDSKGLKVFREALKLASAATGVLDGNSIATTAKDLGLGLGESLGGYAYDKITSKALDGTVFDAA